jgi:fengycin family lipopeptide synthetase D
MIPAQLHLLPELPLTVNGKVDEKRLLTSAVGRDRAASRHIDPVEEKVREICLDVLKIPEIDTDMGLADAGAHSLAIVMIAMRLHENFNVDISVGELQDDISIAAIADRIRKAGDRSNRNVV